MALFGKKKEKEQEIPQNLLRKSVTPASLDPDAFAYGAQEAADLFLRAVYNQSVPALPMARMEESFFYKVRDMISNDLQNCRRSMTVFEIIGFKFSEYDNLQGYAVKSLSYDATYHAQGTYQDRYGAATFDETKTVRFKFLNDARCGWVMCSFTDQF